MSDNLAGPRISQVKSPLRQIDEICDRFEAAWKAGQQPRIEDYLSVDSVDESSPPVRQLLIELAMIDLEYRWRSAGQEPAYPSELTEAVDDKAAQQATPGLLPPRPCLQDYVARYPQLGVLDDLPDELVAEERRARQRWGRGLDSLGGPIGVGTEIEEFKGTERFLLERKIGAGGMGVVYQAYDQERKEVVALKTMRNVEATAIYRLKREFRALADLAHQNLVTLHELFSVGGQWFFTMQFVEGVDFLNYVRLGIQEDDADSPPGKSPDSAPTEEIIPVGQLSTAKTYSAHAETDGGTPSLSEEVGGCGKAASSAPPSAAQLARLRSALRQVAEGVFVLHQAGKLHRDIKPSNVLVTQEGRVVLLDFGVATQLEGREQTGTTGANLVGTVPYMSPEQAAGERLSPASDWYSVGVVLYEALTQRQPFQGRPLDVLRAKQEEDPPSPRELVGGIPQDLDSLCMALLQRDPLQRPSGAEVLLRLGSTPDDGLVLTPLDSSPARQAPFVGREEHLNTLADTFRTMKRGRTVVAYVHGRSGVGKTALVERFLGQIRQHEETVILAGRCYECESVPYKALDSLVDALSHYLVRLPELEVDALLPRDVEALLQLFPVLRRVEAMSRARMRDLYTPDRQELRHRAFNALRELLARLGDRKALVLHIDDLQWGDLDSVTLLSDLLRPPDPPVLLLVVCYRTEDRTTSPVLRTILELQAATSQYIDVCEIEVGPLTIAEARQLAHALIADDPGAERLSQAIARESGGNPCFVEALVRHQQAGPHLPNGSMPREPASLGEVLWARAESLPDAARLLLEMVAVAGYPLRQADACRAAELSSDCREALGILRTAHMIRTGGERLDDKIETYDERIRETVIAHLSPQTAVDYHCRLAAALEASGQADPAALAAHFVGAEAWEKAGEWYAVAAARAADLLAFDRAAELYRLALELRPMSQTEGRNLRRQLADALANAGRSGEAARQYLAAASGATPAESLDLRRRAAMQFFISGHTAEGLEALRTVLAAVGTELPRTPRRALWSLVFRRARLRLRGLGFRQRAAAQVPAGDLTRIDICWSAAAGLSIVDPVFAANFQACNLLLSLRSGEPYRIARSLALEAAQVATAGGPTRNRVKQLLAKAQALARQVDNPHAAGLVSLAAGVAACLQGRWNRAAELSEQAEKIFRDQCTDVAWELDSAQVLGLSALFWSGQVAELARRLPSALAEAQKRGDLYNLARLGTLNLPELAADNPDGAERQLRQSMGPWSQRAFHVQHLGELYAQVQIDIYRGHGAAAWSRIMEQWPLVLRSIPLRVQLTRALIYYARARCALAAAMTAGDPKPLLRVAQRDSHRLKGEKQPWIEAIAELVGAALTAFRGDTPGAARVLKHAATQFDAVEMPLHAASARRRLGELLGGQAGSALIAEADSWMAAQNIQNPTRMAALFAPGFPT